MESYDFLLFVAIILLSTKIFSLLFSKVNIAAGCWSIIGRGAIRAKLSEYIA